MKKRVNKIVFVVVILVALGVAGAAFFLNQASFGKLPSGKRQDQIVLSPHYVSGRFENLEETPVQVNDKGFIADIRDDLFNRKEGLRP